MATQSTSRIRIAALILGFVGLALAASSVPVFAQAPGTAWVQRETPTQALDRNIRILARSPKDFLALIGAGKAALALGDNHAAVGFFGRADEVFPSSPLPQIGLGAAMVADGEAHGALQTFARAQQMGATAAMLGVERGLAYDLLGRHSEAQADYRAALNGSDGDEARRRLALSLAITGDKAGALETLAPLVARGDSGGARCRALVLALTGDLDGARRSLDAAMPGSAARMAPFLARLPALRSDEKAAAVNLGIFPATGTSTYAYVPQPSAGPVTVAARPPGRSGTGSSVSGAMPMSGEGMTSIDHLLGGRNGASANSRPQQVASIPPNARRATSAAPSTAKPRVWVQLASGRDANALPAHFKRIKSRHRDVLEGISGYVAESPDRSRLLIGPFKSMSDANIFVEDLETLNVDAFSWTSPPGETIRKLPTE